MKPIKNPTRLFLVILTGVFFFGALANIYFIFKPSTYTPPEFNPRSVWDWCVFIVNTVFMLYAYFILKNVPNIYARTYWLSLLAIFAAGFVEKYFIRLSNDASQAFSALACGIICAVSILFFYLCQKHGVNLFAGFTYHFKKKIRPKIH